MRLSKRQKECAALMQQGLCNKRIAQRLGIAPGTVKAHLAVAYALGVRPRRPSVSRQHA